MGTRSFIPALATGILATAGMASATTVSGSLSGDPSVGLNPGSNNLTVQFDANATSPPAADANAYIGQINWTTNDTNFLGTGKTVTNFSTYCIEGTQDVIFGHTPAYSWSVTQLAYGSAPSTLVPNPGPSLTAAQVNQMYFYYDNNYEKVDSSSNPNEYATAFQLGLWEIVSGDTLSGEPIDSTMFTGGSFRASGSDNGAFALAAGWVDQAVNGQLDADAVGLTLYALTDSGIQDQIVALPPSNSGSNPPPFPTPTPAALPSGLSVMGCIGAVQLLRRRRQPVVA